MTELSEIEKALTQEADDLVAALRPVLEKLKLTHILHLVVVSVDPDKDTVSFNEQIFSKVDNDTTKDTLEYFFAMKLQEAEDEDNGRTGQA